MVPNILEQDSGPPMRSLVVWNQNLAIRIGAKDLCNPSFGVLQSAQP